jgi:aryl-alcohol dehydrogenase-like predicted oxidoreductase
VIEGRREDLVVSTKARMPIGPGPNDQGTSRVHLLRECERSLRASGRTGSTSTTSTSGTAPRPSRKPARAMDTLVRHGKVRY